jgi:hypothetical protein
VFQIISQREMWERIFFFFLSLLQNTRKLSRCNISYEVSQKFVHMKFDSLNCETKMKNNQAYFYILM